MYTIYNLNCFNYNILNKNLPFNFYLRIILKIFIIFLIFIAIKAASWLKFLKIQKLDKIKKIYYNLDNSCLKFK